MHNRARKPVSQGTLPEPRSDLPSPHAVPPAPMDPMAPQHPFVRTVERVHVALAALVVVAALTMATGWAVAVAAGAALGGLNLRALAALLTGVTDADRGPRGLATLLLPLKFLVLMGAIAAMLFAARLDAAGLLVGLSLLPVALVVGGLWSTHNTGTPAIVALGQPPEA